MGRFREALESRQEFITTCELIPGRGYKGRNVDQALQFASEVKDSPDIHALSLTDNAGGNPALSADVVGIEILNMGVDLIVHFSCKDMNRNAIESRAYLLARSGIENLLVLTGDYPIMGYMGLPKPSFDMGAVNALYFLNNLNRGLEIEAGKRQVTLESTNFYLGAVVSPFKWTEASSVMQYIKLEKKIRAGAHFFITQLGFDALKHIELLKYVREYLGLDVPILGSVYVLSSGAARFMNKGEVPGCYVNDRLLEKIKEESKTPDKGKEARLKRSARLVAVLKGLGYNGVHIEGLNLSAEDVRFILEKAGEIGENWRDHLGEFNYSSDDKPFYYFKGGDSLEFLNKKKEDLEPNITPRKSIFSLTFWLTRILHKLIFIEGTPGCALMRGISSLAKKYHFFYRIFRRAEHLTKRVLFDCRECDDCALFESYYLCPESQCPKGMRVGPCGGSRVKGHCEVFPERMCIWERVYWRAKNRRECHKLNYIIPPRDWNLYETSSWMNYFLKYDHSAKKLEFFNHVYKVPEDMHIRCKR